MEAGVGVEFVLYGSEEGNIRITMGKKAFVFGSLEFGLW